jgi:pimeloyl-ACP methyl ester carboxylesterase
MGTIREQALLLGKRKSLVAILAQDPASVPTAAELPAIVILNSGIIHRVGPNRIFVRLSRMLAEAGHVVVRFDLSGIGDSEARKDGLAPLDGALADIREALDSLEAARQTRRVILIGLCSGADYSIVYGGQDPRVVGVVLIDPSVPRTRGYYMRHYRGRMFRWRSWLNFASGRHPFWRMVRKTFTPGHRPSAEEPHLEPPPDLQAVQVRKFLESAYARTVAAGVDVMAIFTGGREDQHNDPRQLLEAFPSVAFGSRLQLECISSADHTFTSRADRCRLMNLVSEWLSRRPTPLSPNVNTSVRYDPETPGQKSANNCG